MSDTLWLTKVEVLAHVRAKTPDEAIRKLSAALEAARFYADPSGESEAWEDEYTEDQYSSSKVIK